MNTFLTQTITHSTTGIKTVLEAGPTTGGSHLQIVSGSEVVQCFGPQGASHFLDGTTGLATAGNPTVRDDFNYASIAVNQSQAASYNDFVLALPEYLKGYYLGGSSATPNHLEFAADENDFSFSIWRADGVSLLTPTVSQTAGWDVTTSLFTTDVVEDIYYVDGLQFSHFPSSGLINGVKFNGTNVPFAKGSIITPQGTVLDINPYFTKALT